MTASTMRVKNFIEITLSHTEINVFLCSMQKFKTPAKNGMKTRPMHRRTDAKLYPPERQLTKVSEPMFDHEGEAKGQIRPQLKI